MWQRFTGHAKRVVLFAQEEARSLGENYVSTEHLLLGLTRETSSCAALVLDKLGIPLEQLRSEIDRRMARGASIDDTNIQLTPRTKRVIDLAYNEARQLDNTHVGTEHLLLGMIREGGGMAARILQNFNVTPEAVHSSLVEIWQQIDVEQQEDPQTDPVEPQVNRPVRPEAKPQDQGDEEFVRKQAAETTEFGSLIQRVRSVIKHLRQTTPYLFNENNVGANNRLAGRVAAILNNNEDEKWIYPGELGIAQTGDTRTHVEIAHDADTFGMLIAAYQAKDTHGYSQLAHGDQTLFLIPNGTPLKMLVAPPKSQVAVANGGAWVRVLGGPYAGYAGWMFIASFARTGTDDSPFPPPVENHADEREDDL